MIPASVVIDTNVLVAGLLTRDAKSPPARVLEGMLRGRFPYLLSPALLAEYRSVLLRSRIRSRHGLAADEVDRLLEDLVAGAVWREPKAQVSAPEPGDDHVWALVACHPGTALVTGDRLLLDNPPPGIPVLTPGRFLSTHG